MAFTEQQAGRRFAFTFAACAIIALVLCYWLFSFGERAQSSATQNGTAQTTISTTNSGRLLSSSSPVDPVKDPPTEPEARLSEQAAKPMIRSNEKATDVFAPLPSITFEATPAQRLQSIAESLGSVEAAAGVSGGNWKERSKDFTAHADSRGCKACMNSQFGGLSIPKGCVYSAYTITQVLREPNIPIEQSDEHTSYSDGLETDTNGRIYGVRLSVSVNKIAASAVAPAITMRLTVVVMCPNDLDIDGWT